MCWLGNNRARTESLRFVNWFQNHPSLYRIVNVLVLGKEQTILTFLQWFVYRRFAKEDSRQFVLKIVQ